MEKTEKQYNKVINECQEIFLKKTKDYGTSWRVYRPISVADQIYIKAFRIRNIQELKAQKIGDDIENEFKGIVNYAVIGLIQLDLDKDDPEQMETEDVKELYALKVEKAGKLMADKNHDYGEAWRMMSQESFADLILSKILRIKQIISNEGQTIASEGIDANFLDILNYAAFALILINEEVTN